MSRLRAGFAATWLAAVVLAAPASAQQNPGIETTLPGGAGGKSIPVNIAADNGIEWRQADHVYIARGNVKAVRGEVTVYADEMRAHYRPVARKNPDGTIKEPPKPPPKPANAKPPKPGQSPGAEMNEGPTEIYRIEADGHVRFVTKTQTGSGDHADYDVDKTMLVLTGKHMQINSAHDVLTARDSIEWYDDKQLGVARGDARDLHDGKQIAGDVLLATFARNQDKGQNPPPKAQSQQGKGQEEGSQIQRVDVHGHVFVSSKDQIGRGDTGVYDAKTGIVTLTGHVRLTRGQNEMSGAYGVVDLNKNIGHLLPAAPGTRPAASGNRVHGLIMPNKKPGDAKPKKKPAEKSQP